MSREGSAAAIGNRNGGGGGGGGRGVARSAPSLLHDDEEFTTSSRRQSESLKDIIINNGSAKGKGRKKKVRLYMHPPSIPTKFQTIHFDEGEKRAFGGSGRRFTYKVSDLPGPGYYAKAAEKLEKVFGELSISKKGFGGFASQGHRFKNSITSNTSSSSISPAKYNPTTPVYSASLSSSLSPAFRNATYMGGTSSSKSMVRTKTGFKPTPGPGEYAPEKTDALQHHARAIQSVFKSKSSRSMATNNTDSQYTNYSESLEPVKVDKIMPPKPIIPTSSFMASSRMDHEPKVYGPSIGQYDIEKVIVKNPAKPFKSKKMINLAKAPDLKKREPTSNQTAIPGSGMTPLAFPSPGHYEISKVSELLMKSAPTPSMSKTPRFKNVKGDMPAGPGTYQPYPTGPRSFHLNLSQSWA